MQSFEFLMPTHIIFGECTEQRCGELVKAYGGSRVLVVYGGDSAKKSGLIDRVTQSLQDSGLAYELLGGVHPNPTLSFAQKGVEQSVKFKADFLLAVGGGSVIDCAKAIADGSPTPEYPLWDYWSRQRPLTQALPVGVVLTIPAAGSESSDSAVLTNDTTMVKRGLNSPLHRPRFAILNPALTYTLPPFQIACGIVDMMMHTMDRYFNPICTNQLTDEIAEGLLRTVITNGKIAIENRAEPHAMSELMWAGSVSHNGLTGLGNQTDFAPHQLSHELSAKYDVAHGAALSSIWSSWAQFTMDTNPERFAQFGTKVWGIDGTGKTAVQIATEAIDTTEAFFSSLHMPVSIPQLPCGKLPDDILEELATRCTYYGTRTIGSFRVLGHNEILAIYTMANKT